MKMKFGKLKLLFFFIFLLNSFNINAAFNAFDSKKSPTSAATDFIKELGYSPNEPQKLKDGSFAVFIVGSADILSNTDSDAFVNSRRIAYDRAVLNAKANFAKYLEREIVGRITVTIQEGTFPTEEELQSETLGNTVMDYMQKANMLLMAKLDSALQEQGVDIRSLQEKSIENQKKLEEAALLAEKTLSSAEYTRSIKLTANRLVAGVQILGVFENFEPGATKGTIAVAGVYSDKSLKVAQALLHNNPNLAPKTNELEANESIESFITNFGDGVLVMQGVKLITNEKGEQVLLSFGQSGVKSETTRSEMNAYVKAETNANQYIDQFVGEMVSAFTSIEESETLLELEGGLEHYNYEEGFKNREVADFGSGYVSGVQKVIEWVEPHPLTGHKMVGVILSWSPSSAIMSKIAKSGELSKEEEDLDTKNKNSSISEITKIEEGYSSSGASKNVDF